jgi:hypothetical protein
MTIYHRLILTLCLTAFLAGGCATNVKPWERGDLAKDYMAVEPDSLQRTINEQVVTSKEASSGGYAVAGGGCGCN